MTTIAWDGATLAADRMLNSGGWKDEGTKIWRVGEDLVGYAGPVDAGMLMLHWYRDGCQLDKFPPIQSGESSACTLLVITRLKDVLRYDASPYPMTVTTEQYAMGTGRDIARTAMYLGKTAVEAVELACKFDVHSGMGIDYLRL